MVQNKYSRDSGLKPPNLEHSVLLYLVIEVAVMYNHSEPHIIIYQKLKVLINSKLSVMLTIFMIG